MPTTHRVFALVVSLVAWLVAVPTAQAATVDVPRPGQHEHVLDLADMLDAKAERRGGGSRARAGVTRSVDR